MHMLMFNRYMNIQHVEQLLILYLQSFQKYRYFKESFQFNFLILLDYLNTKFLRGLHFEYYLIESLL